MATKAGEEVIGAAVAITGLGAGAIATAGLTYATVAPACTFWGPTIARGSIDSKQIALTFDDGPTPSSTERVLKILAKTGVKAAFFVVGVNVQQHPELLGRIHEDGHVIANHTFDHSHYTVFRRLPYWKRQIADTDAVVESVIGVRPALFRPPMGVKTWHTARATRESGHTLVTWSRRAMDGFPTCAERIVRRLSEANAGDILLLHDGVEPHSPHEDRSATIEALPALIERLRSRDLTPVRLDALLGITPYQSRAAAATAT